VSGKKNNRQNSWFDRQEAFAGHSRALEKIGPKYPINRRSFVSVLTMAVTDSIRHRFEDHGRMRRKFSPPVCMINRKVKVTHSNLLLKFDRKQPV
jgi:hypothetical protein